MGTNARLTGLTAPAVPQTDFLDARWQPALKVRDPIATLL